MSLFLSKGISIGFPQIGQFISKVSGIKSSSKPKGSKVAIMISFLCYSGMPVPCEAIISEIK